jgi:hypothetical protein
MRAASVVLLGMVFGAGCIDRGPQRTGLPPLQIREFQTRTYETTDTAMVMKALLNVLQDEGYVIKTANTELGLITARKEESKPPCFLADACATLVSWDCSVNVSAFGTQTKVRVSVQQAGTTLTNHVLYSTEIEDAAYYQNFFAKVDKGVFIQKERL